MTSLLTEKLSGARLIKTFRLEDYAAGKLDQSFRQVLALRLEGGAPARAARADAGGAWPALPLPA